MSRDALAGLVGAGFGLVFVLVNAGGLGSPGALVARAAGVAAFLLVVALLVRGGGGPSTQPAPGALRVYQVSVALEVVALFVGVRLLGATGRTDLALPWVVLVVGVHFLPFARAFRTPAYTVLGLVLVGVAVAGAVLAGAGVDGEVVRAVTGLAAGAALLAFGPLTARARRTEGLSAPRVPQER